MMSATHKDFKRACRHIGGELTHPDQSTMRCTVRGKHGWPSGYQEYVDETEIDFHDYGLSNNRIYIKSRGTHIKIYNPQKGHIEGQPGRMKIHDGDTPYPEYQPSRVVSVSKDGSVESELQF